MLSAINTVGASVAKVAITTSGTGQICATNRRREEQNGALPFHPSAAL